MNPSQRSNLLEKAKALKDIADLKMIYVKKDVNPMIRKEFQRLRDVEKKEKEKPENRGKPVKYDPATRNVYVGDQVIDSFQPTFLPRWGT
jgi:hypothetical protein